MTILKIRLTFHQISRSGAHFFLDHGLLLKIKVTPFDSQGILKIKELFFQDICGILLFKGSQKVKDQDRYELLSRFFRQAP